MRLLAHEASWALAEVPDQRVDLDGINIIEFLQGILNLSLVGFDVDNEDQCIVLFDLLHRAFCVQRMYDDLIFVEAFLMRYRLPWILGRS